MKNRISHRKFQESVLGWFRENKRDLPWRRTKDPYAIWVSEIMLQQTQVATVIPYYERFLARFPTVETLASAPIEEVISLWAGLGYYSRARNLHRTAQEIVSRGGRMPEDYEAVLSLPGIGRYTAGAILSIAFNLAVPLLDGNVMRLLTRVFGIRGDPRFGKTHRLLWERAEELIPEGAAGDFNQGLMELGAMVCIPDAPRCEACPLSGICEAKRLGIQTELPEKAKGPEPEYVEDVATVIRRNSEVLVARRFPEGLWGGLWEFPRGTRSNTETLVAAAQRAVKETVGCEVRVSRTLTKIKHTVAHRRVTLHAFEGILLEGEPKPIRYADLQWMRPEDLHTLPFSSPQTRITKALLHHENMPRQLDIELME